MRTFVPSPMMALKTYEENVTAQLLRGEASAHFPKFVLPCSTDFHELRKVMGTRKRIDSSTALSI